jgi:hypothetical protein
MKKVIIALALFSATAQAEVIAYTSNKGGGKIVITSELCRDNKNLLAYSQTNDSPTLVGCWTNDQSFIHIQWYDSELRSYDYEGWTVVKKKKITL